MDSFKAVEPSTRVERAQRHGVFIADYRLVGLQQRSFRFSTEQPDIGLEWYAVLARIRPADD